MCASVHLCQYLNAVPAMARRGRWSSWNRRYRWLWATLFTGKWTLILCKSSQCSNYWAISAAPMAASWGDNSDCREAHSAKLHLLGLCSYPVALFFFFSMTPAYSEAEAGLFFPSLLLYHFNYMQVIRSVLSQGTSKTINKALWSLFLGAYQDDQDI